MDITSIVAENLSAWMEGTPALDTIQKLEAKSGVGFGTIRRARKGEGNVTIENLAKIAAAFGKPPSDLLLPPTESKVEALRGISKVYRPQRTGIHIQWRAALRVCIREVGCIQFLAVTRTRQV